MDFRRSEVKDYKGKPAIYVDGRPMSPFFYALTDQPGGNKTWETIPHKSISDFAKIGTKFFQCDVSMENVYFKAGLDITFAIKQLRGILDACPDCCVMFRLHVNPPRWWIDEHPSELVAYADAETLKNRYLGVHESFMSDDLKNVSRISFASDVWRNEYTDVVRRFISLVREREESRALVAIQIANGIYGENHYWASMHHMPDVGAAMTAYFEKWLKNRYGTVENLRRAYNDDKIDFDKIKPAGRERDDVDRGIFRDPEKHRAISDYFECQHELTANNIVTFAKVVKEASDGKLLAGAFYGYYFSLFGKAAAGGHLSEEIVLNSEYVDFMCAPQAYGKINREVGGPALSRGIIESVRLHGKVWLDERDQPTHYGTHDPGMIAYPKPESIYNNRAHVLQSFIRGAGMWFYDFGRYCSAGWWDDPECMKENEELKKLTDAMFEREYDAPADVLLVFDTKVFLYTSATPEKDPFTDTITNVFVVNAYKSGAAVECIYLSDLERADLSRFRAVVFANCFRIDGKTFDYIENVVKKKCQNVIFFTYPGYTDGRKLQPDGPSKLCGMAMGERERQLVPKMLWKGDFASGNEFDISDLYLHRKSYNFGTAPMPEVTDKDAVTEAEYEDGAVSAAVKKDGECRVWFFAVPPLVPSQISTLFSKCGCHIYRKPGNATLCGNGVVELNATDPERGVLTLKNGRKIEYSLERSETAVFDANTGEKFAFTYKYN
ncbi:MAG: beta-galactosidase [Clostridia bacterium]|nr:beta-galactosidase [Clostridia bacterium]